MARGGKKRINKNFNQGVGTRNVSNSRRALRRKSGKDGEVYEGGFYYPNGYSYNIDMVSPPLSDGSSPMVYASVSVTAPDASLKINFSHHFLNMSKEEKRDYLLNNPKLQTKLKKLDSDGIRNPSKVKYHEGVAIPYTETNPNSSREIDQEFIDWCHVTQIDPPDWSDTTVNFHLDFDGPGWYDAGKIDVTDYTTDFGTSLIDYDRYYTCIYYNPNNVYGGDTRVAYGITTTCGDGVVSANAWVSSGNQCNESEGNYDSDCEPHGAAWSDNSILTCTFGNVGFADEVDDGTIYPTAGTARGITRQACNPGFDGDWGGTQSNGYCDNDNQSGGAAFQYCGYRGKTWCGGFTNGYRCKSAAQWFPAGDWFDAYYQNCPVGAGGCGSGCQGCTGHCGGSDNVYTSPWMDTPTVNSTVNRFMWQYVYIDSNNIWDGTGGGNQSNLIYPGCIDPLADNYDSGAGFDLATYMYMTIGNGDSDTSLYSPTSPPYPTNCNYDNDNCIGAPVPPDADDPYHSCEYSNFSCHRRHYGRHPDINGLCRDGTTPNGFCLTETGATEGSNGYSVCNYDPTGVPDNDLCKEPDVYSSDDECETLEEDICAMNTIQLSPFENWYCCNQSLNIEWECYGEGGGDINQDGVVDVLDIVALVDHILGGTSLTGVQLELADLNENGIVNVVDIVALVNRILGSRTTSPEDRKELQRQLVRLQKI